MAQATLTKDSPNRAAMKPKRRKMVRKQVYLQPQQETKLKELAERQHTTEAELIREAVDAYLNTPSIPNPGNLPLREAAWQQMLAYVREREKEPITGEPYKWKREDGYDNGEDGESPRGWNIKTTEDTGNQ